MAYSINAGSGKEAYNVKHYIVDCFEDMKKLPTSAAAGSTAFVVDSSRSFMLNNKRQWVEFNPVGSGAPQQENIIWDGGTPEGDGCGCDCGSDQEQSTQQYIWDGGEVNG